MSRLDSCYSIADLRKEAKSRLPKGVFEFLDRGTEEEIALTENREAFQRLKLRTRFLRDLSKRDMGTQLFGKRSNLPMAIGPTGIAGLCWYQGELLLAKAAAKVGIPFAMATASLTDIDTVAREAGGRLWYQLYMWQETELSYQMIGRAKDLGFEALVVTIDHALGRLREHNDKNGFAFPFSPNLRAFTDMALHPRWLAGVMGRYAMSGKMPRQANYPKQFQRMFASKNAKIPTRHIGMTWDDISRLRDFWPGKLIVKSILGAEDAKMAVERGADAVVVSNHGGRAMDSAIPSIDVLPEVAAAVGGRVSVLFDSGIRRGSDIAKAIALGADSCLVGRATLYGVGAGGQEGAEKALNMLGNEFEKTMGYIGCRTVAELDRTIFASRLDPNRIVADGLGRAPAGMADTAQ
ncbi:MAG: alpha-hydroxy acid oxidase [Rhodospirillales bacterium]